MDKQGTSEEEEDMEEDSEDSELLRLMARHTQLKDLLHAHDIFGTFLIMSFTHLLYISLKPPSVSYTSQILLYINVS